MTREDIDALVETIDRLAEAHAEHVTEKAGYGPVCMARRDLRALLARLFMGKL